MVCTGLPHLAQKDFNHIGFKSFFLLNTIEKDNLHHRIIKRITLLFSYIAMKLTFPQLPYPVERFGLLAG